MRRLTRPVVAVLASVCAAALPATALAHPESGEGDGHGHDEIPVALPSLPNFGPGASNFALLDAVDKDGTTNSDLAFYGNRAYAGTYDGFRVVDISRPGDMRLLSDTRCRANQGDVSVFEARDGRRILLQSIDRPVTAPDCTGVDTPLVQEDEQGVTRNRARFGYEGLRMFDVTDSRSPRFLKFFRTACGSHTHTLVPDPDDGQVHAYVASYPGGSNTTAQVDRAESDRLGLTCEAPHQKISVVSIPLADPESGVVRQRTLSPDTEPYDGDGPYDATGGPNGGPIGTGPGFKACHDLQAFLPRDIMVASCSGDVQYWDISDRGNPTSSEGEPQTHIKRELAGSPESFDFMHNATVTWDGRYVLATDESGGGGEARCDGANTQRGFTFIYPLVQPGESVDGFDDLVNKYIPPRPQNTEICVSHNGSILPVADRYLQVQAFYQAGNSLFDFTDPAAAAPREIGYSDIESPLGASDSWSTYWYNGVVYVNGGLNRRGANGNRGLESYRVTDTNGERFQTARWGWSNPQTQEEFQVPGAEQEEGARRR